MGSPSSHSIIYTTPTSALKKRTNTTILRYRHLPPRPRTSRNPLRPATTTTATPNTRHPTRRTTPPLISIHIHNLDRPTSTPCQTQPIPRTQHRPLRRRRPQGRTIPQHSRARGRPHPQHSQQAPRGAGPRRQSQSRRRWHWRGRYTARTGRRAGRAMSVKCTFH
jgi:hypothetical protein